MASILVTGGTGLIGKSLCALLKEKGHNVFILSRTRNNNPTTYYWNLEENYIDEEAIQLSDYIIHLAGENIAEKRWTKKRKLQLIYSRVATTEFLFKKVQELNPKLKGFIAASGIGYYGAITSNKIYLENNKPYNDFLSEVCINWEEASKKFILIGIRTILLRTGVVLTKNGGALEKMSLPIKYGFGAVLGSGKQYIPWIHIEDLCAMYLWVLENENLNGVYNAVTPEHVTNKELTLAIAKKLNKSLWLPNIPSFILKFLLGSMAVMLLNGSRVSSKKIIKLGFKFKFKYLNDALDNLFQK